jgi:hypothetical protein
VPEAHHPVSLQGDYRVNFQEELQGGLQGGLQEVLREELQEELLVDQLTLWEHCLGRGLWGSVRLLGGRQVEPTE